MASGRRARDQGVRPAAESRRQDAEEPIILGVRLVEDDHRRIQAVEGARLRCHRLRLRVPDEDHVPEDLDPARYEVGRPPPHLLHHPEDDPGLEPRRRPADDLSPDDPLLEQVDVADRRHQGRFGRLPADLEKELGEAPELLVLASPPPEERHDEPGLPRLELNRRRRPPLLDVREVLDEVARPLPALRPPDVRGPVDRGRLQIPDLALDREPDPLARDDPPREHPVRVHIRDRRVTPSRDLWEFRRDVAYPLLQAFYLAVMPERPAPELLLYRKPGPTHA